MGVVIGLTTTLWSKRVWMLTASAISGFLFVLHYFLLGAFMGALVDGLGVVKAVLGIFFVEVFWIKYSVICIPIIYCLALETAFDSYVVTAATTISTIASFTVNEQRMRLIMLSSGPFWLYYNYHHGSIAGMTGDFCGMSMAAGSYVYYALRSKGRIMTT